MSKPSSIRNALLALGIGASLAAGGLGFATGAEARVTGPRDTDKAQICGWLQDQYDVWWNRYFAAPAGSPAETKAYQMMGNLQNGWLERDCDSTFGSISKPLPNKQFLATGIVTAGQSR